VKETHRYTVGGSGSEGDTGTTVGEVVVKETHRYTVGEVVVKETHRYRVGEVVVKETQVLQ
jgi:hypothetical protein